MLASAYITAAGINFSMMALELYKGKLYTIILDLFTINAAKNAGFDLSCA
jgi:hypothetical protein